MTKPLRIDHLRIDEPPRVVTWEESASIAVGFSQCDGCGIETPEPATSVLVEFAKHGGNHRTLWPFDTSFSSSWMWSPPGWTSGVGEPGEIHCPECTRKIREAIAVAIPKALGAT